MATPADFPTEPSDRLTDPRDLLTGYLDHYRDALLRKLDGLSNEELRAAPLPSGWTPLQLLKHLTHVEIRWLRWCFGGEDVARPWGDRATNDPADPWHVGEDESLEDLRTAFLETCERSRRIVAGASLGESSRPGPGYPVPDRSASLAWILFHLLQEYARHLGHLDAARELIDGRTGE